MFLFGVWYQIMNIEQIIADELKIKKEQVKATIELIDEGCTIPFIARYRKEKTGALNDEVLRLLEQRLTYLQDNMDRINTAMEALNIASRRQMTPKNMLNMIKELLKNEMWFKKIKVNLELSETACMIDMCDGILPYIICQDIEYRANTECQEINVNEIVEGDKVIIKIESEYAMNDNQFAELKKVAELCKELRVNINDTITEYMIAKEK